jgi:hypothetical protein
MRRRRRRRKKKKKKEGSMTANRPPGRRTLVSLSFSLSSLSLSPPPKNLSASGHGG